ncbi:hypothetical protein QBC39DRAFT_106991 [Podospora conica]|nr:hypothetical protein QBC39DRAFT_106991 [Schizothecium conicum]
MRRWKLGWKEGGMITQWMDGWMAFAFLVTPIIPISLSWFNFASSLWNVAGGGHCQSLRSTVRCTIWRHRGRERRAGIGIEVAVAGGDATPEKNREAGTYIANHIAMHLN